MSIFRRLGNLKTKTGLFNINGACSPEGFNLLKEQSLKQADDIVYQIVKNDGKRNLVGLFDELSNCLCKVADLSEFVRVSHPKAPFREAAGDASVAISTKVEQLNTDRRLYEALKSTNFDDPVDDYVARLFQFDFEQCGIHLNDTERNQVLRLNEAILRLGSIFTSNSNQGRLAKRNQLPPSIQITLPSYDTDQVLMKSVHADSDSEEVREAAYKIYLQPDKTQDEILTNLLLCRLRLAQLCGFPSYAHRAVRGSIAGSPEVVGDFLNLLNDQLKNLADKDYSQMLDLKLRDDRRKSDHLNAWDVPYYSARFKRHLYDEKVAQCLPYFSLRVCMDGLNVVFTNLYGVRIRIDKGQPGELWHEDVIKLSIIDEQTNDIIGHIYCDLFERASKQQQDCHHTIRGGCYLSDGTYQLPIVVLIMSLQRGNNNIALLPPSMVENLFHEMGHAMHSMMARTKYQHVTGTRCSTDLAEVPSILMEYFVSDPRVLRRFARHYKTGEEMPTDLMKCWIESKKVFQASETQLQLFYAALDQAYHSSSLNLDLDKVGSTELDLLEPTNPVTTTQILARSQREYYSLPYIQGTAWQLRFSHLVGYGAKYYSYLVSRAVASAIWRKLFQQDPLSRLAGTKFKNEVLIHGGGKAADVIASDVLECKVDAEYLANSVMKSIGQP